MPTAEEKNSGILSQKDMPSIIYTCDTIQMAYICVRSNLKLAGPVEGVKIHRLEIDISTFPNILEDV
jgi:hypothetical protein